jgi:hypothetical protein
MLLLLILCVTFLCPTLGVKTWSSPDNVVEIEPEEERDTGQHSIELFALTELTKCVV